MWLLLLGFCPSTQYNGPFEPTNQGKRALATARVGISPSIIIIITIIIIIIIITIIVYLLYLVDQ